MTLTVRRGLKARNLKTRRTNTTVLQPENLKWAGQHKVNMKYGEYDGKVKEGVTKASSILYQALQTKQTT